MIKSAKTESATPSDERESAHPGWWAALAVLLTAWLGVPMVLPLVAAAPWIVFTWRRPDGAPRTAPTIRWALAVWVTMAAMSALAGARAVRAVPLGPQAAASARAWLEGASGAAPSWVVMGAWVILAIATAIPLRGAFASVVVAHALLISAIHASVVFANSANLLHAAVIALPLWTAALLFGMILLIDPLATGGLSGVRSQPRRLALAAGLLALAFVFRLVLASPVTALAHRVALP